MSLDENEGNMLSMVKLMSAVLLIVIVFEYTDVTSVHFGKTTVSFSPMLYAVILGVIITPELLGKYIKPLGRFITCREISLTGNVVMLALLPLGVTYGTLVGPNIRAVINAGPALILQEIGNLGSVLIAMPVALLLGTYLVGSVIWLLP